MTDTIDKLVFALDGDLTPLQGKFAEADAQAARAGKSISESFNKPLTQGAKESGAAAQTAAQGWGQWAASVERTAPALKVTSAAAVEADKATKSLHGSTAVATREFRALFDEISSGRTRQSPGTLAIIATRVFGISGATLAWGAALAAIPVGLAVAAAMAESSLNKIDEALKRTGDQAGITVDQIRRIAESGIPGLSVNSAQGVLGILSSRANIDPSQLANVARAVPGFARASGTDASKAAEELEKLLADPAKGAQQLNEEFKLLDVSTTRQIEDLEAAGRTAEAQALLVKGLNDRFDGLAKSGFSLAAVFDKIGSSISNFWTHTGQVLGGSDETDQQRLTRLQSRLAGAQAYRTRYGGFGPGANEAVASDIQNLPGQIAALQARITKTETDAAAGRAHAVSNSQIGFGLKIAEQYDEQASKAKTLGEHLSALNIALTAAVGPNAKYRDEILKERDAVDLALKNQRSPAQIAAEEANDQRRVAAAPASQRDTLRAKLAAQREYERNISDPKTAPYAAAIRDSQLSVASLNNKDLNEAEAARKKAAEEAARMAENLSALKSEASAARDLAAAYDISDAAGVKAKATGEIDVEITKKQIAEKDRLAAVEAKVAAAYAQADAAVSKQINTLKLANAQLQGERGAGGNPALVAAARRYAEVDQAVKDLSPEDAARRRPQLLAQYQQRDASTAVLSGQASIYGARTNLANLNAQAGIFSPDALRQLQVMQSTMESLVKTGLDPASDDFKQLYDQLLPFNEQISDLTEKLQESRQAAADYASAITQPLEQFLEKGGSIRKMLSDVFSGIGKTTIHDFLIQPLQKGLESGIGSLLGISGAPDGSLTNPYYVIPAPQGAITGALLGGGAGGGGLSGILGNILGGTGGGGGIFGSLFGGVGSFISSLFGGGKAGGGAIDPGKWYVVGEDGPEIMGPGNAGHVTPMSPPNTQSGASGQSVSTNFNATIVVQGTGDKELMANMETGARKLVGAAIAENNKNLRATQRGSLINSNKRALS